MDDVLKHLFSNSIDKKYIKENLSDIGSLYKRNPRGPYSTFINNIYSCHMDLISKRSDIQSMDKSNYINTDPIKVLLEIICFLSSIDISLKYLIGKRVLFIGTGYGIEVLILRSFGIEAYGVENDELMFSLSSELKDIFNQKYDGNIFSQEMFFFNNISNFIENSMATYDLILGRNINPLSNLDEYIFLIESILSEQGNAIIQWDALYKEQNALSVYSPKKGIYYNERLRELLDSLNRDSFKIKKTTARFLYKIKKR